MSKTRRRRRYRQRKRIRHAIQWIKSYAVTIKTVFREHGGFVFNPYFRTLSDE